MSLQQELKSKLERECVSLRRAEALTGVSFATISRFLRDEGYLSGRCLEKLQAYVDGKPQTKANPVSSRRFKVGSKTFIITIEEVTK